MRQRILPPYVLRRGGVPRLKNDRDPNLQTFPRVRHIRNAPLDSQGYQNFFRHKKSPQGLPDNFEEIN